MRFIHTSDWHLGRLFHGQHLTADQEQILVQFIELAREVKPDAIVIAGDIYDRSVPPPEAVNLLDQVLSELVLGLKVPVIMIAGNHDSPDRLGFGSRLLADAGLHVFGQVESKIHPVILKDKSGPVYFYALPYAEPPVVRERFSDSTIDTHNRACEIMLGQVRAGHPQDMRSVLVTHAFVAGGAESESERPLSVGGTGMVDASIFAGFNYVALGHLHRPQKVASDTICYSGSLLKYSFSEVDQKKSVNIVEIDEDGYVLIEQVSLAPKRDLRIIEGLLDDVMAGSQVDAGKDDYVLVRLLDKGAIFDAMGKLRMAYPNILHIERPGLAVEGQMAGSPQDHRKIDDRQLFGSFFQEVTGEPLSEDEAQALKVIIEDMARLEREVAK